MKKLLLCFLVSASLIACTNQKTKTETKIEAITEITGTVTSTGPDVDMMKNSFTYFANGDWANLALCYADSAKAFHNVWPSKTDTTVGVNVQNIIEGFKKQRELIDGNIILGRSIYEVETKTNGDKYGHSWLEMSWTSKKGVTGKMVIFSSFGINKDGKLTYHWPIYDTKDVVNLK
jgi:hypothetical protein